MKTVCRCGFVLLAALAMTLRAQAASPNGAWSVSSNGFVGVMGISVDPNTGQVVGHFLNDDIKGFWDSTTGRLMFYRAIGGTTSSTPPDSIQIYTGYMFGTAPHFQLSGYFEAFSSTGGTASRNVFAWYAVHE